jgi:hypothetical protein
MNENIAYQETARHVLGNGIAAVQSGIPQEVYEQATSLVHIASDDGEVAIDWHGLINDDKAMSIASMGAFAPISYHDDCCDIVLSKNSKRIVSSSDLSEADLRLMAKFQGDSSEVCVNLLAIRALHEKLGMTGVHLLAQLSKRASAEGHTLRLCDYLPYQHAKTALQLGRSRFRKLTKTTGGKPDVSIPRFEAGGFVR